MKPIDLRKATNTQIEDNLLEFEEHNGKMEIMFDTQRLKVKEQLEELFDVLRTNDYKLFITLQSNALALRTTIQEQITYFMQKLTKANANNKVAIGNRCEYYATGYGIKVTDSTRNKYIDRDLSERDRNVELFQTHIEFLRESRISCDQINYAVKNMVGLVAYINI